MSEDTGLQELVAEEVTDQLDVADLIDGGSIEDGIDAGEIGASVGRQFGERLGRTIGASVGGEIHDTLSSAFESGTDAADGEGEEEEENGDGNGGTKPTADTLTLKQLLAELVTAIRTGFVTALDDSNARDSVESIAQNVTEGTSLEGVFETSSETETQEEGADGEDESGAEAAETADADDRDADTELEQAPEDLENLRRETLVDFLGVMSYQDLQSVAKEVGVKANLSREEMTDEIIETVAAEEGDGANGDADERDSGGGGEDGGGGDGGDDTDGESSDSE
ncbi:hypothetical protein [Natrialba aegyptia]|uniref:Uncharacterized protein n=1 Tax=Natrialba aegyptia DSM 13077 TaxID=1227491 RepID=M0BDY3_9EURY|nr:hypothetical protein [Natrialba aegyptia]ELZ09025.1 hypothetical protein C480_02708 [Natrialba aegyptia DSM 13077]